MPLPEEAVARTGLPLEELLRKVPHFRSSPRSNVIRFSPDRIEAFMAGPIRGGAMAYPVLAARVGTVYFIEAEGTERLKIGFTSQETVDERIHRLRTASPFPLRLVVALPGSMAIERVLHELYAAHRVTGTREWFYLREELAELVDVLQRDRAWP